jgi:RimJ/RimL family protein N-acetyltransferase
VNHYADWPIFDLLLRCRDVELRPVREADLPELAALEPDDYEMDPRLEMLPGLTDRQNRQRLFHQGYWKALGTWSPSSWVLHLAVRHAGRLVGVQTLEGDDFPVLRTVDSASWLIPEVRGRGLGVAMRTAALGLAFDHLGAVAAITSAREDNHASLGVSRRIGYRDNGVGFVAERSGRVLLRHLRLPVEEWTHGAEVTAAHVDRCLAWFGITGGPEIR